MGGYVFISYSTKNQQLADFVKDMVVRKECVIGWLHTAYLRVQNTHML